MAEIRKEVADTAAMKAALEKEARLIVALAEHRGEGYSTIGKRIVDHLLPLVSRLIEAAEKRQLMAMAEWVKANDHITEGSIGPLMNVGWNMAMNTVGQQLIERALAVSTPTREQEKL